MDEPTTSQTQDEVPVEQPTTDQTSNTNLDNVDPRLVVTEEVEEQPEPQAEPEPEPTPAPEEPAPQSQRENKRIAELTRKLAEANRSQPQPSNQSQQNNQIIGEGDYDLDQINGLARDYGDQRYNDGQNQGLEAVKSINFNTRLEIDAPKVEAEYEVLNPRSDKFDPAVTDWMNQLYYKTVGLKVKQDGSYTVENANIRYKEFADGFMEAVDTLATSRAVDSKQNLAAQAAQQGLRPNSVAKKSYQGTDPKKMTIEQLQAAVNQELGIA